MRISPLNIEIILESNPLKSRVLVWRLAVSLAGTAQAWSQLKWLWQNLANIGISYQ